MNEKEFNKKQEQADINISKIFNPENKHKRIMKEISNMINKEMRY